MSLPEPPSSKKDGSAGQGSLYDSRTSDDSRASSLDATVDGGKGETPDLNDGSLSDGPENSDAALPDRSAADTSVTDTSVADTSVVDTSVEDVSEADSLPENDAEDPVECDLTGVYGGRVTLEAFWGGRSFLGGLVALVDAGRAPIVIHIMYSIDSIDEDGTINATAKTCNIELPPFYTSIICEVYQPVFPPQAWESEANPIFDITGKVDCLDPGCVVHIDPTPALLGVELEDPRGSWPEPSETQSLECASGEGADCFPDHDDDGISGITADLLTEGKPANSDCLMLGTYPGEFRFRAAPLSTDLNILFSRPVPRTDRIHLGTRAIVGGDPVIMDNCIALKGPALAEGFQSRAISCMIQPGMPTGTTGTAGGNTSCTSDQRQFMDENLPLYNCMKKGDVPDPELTAIEDHSPSNGPDISLVKLGELDDDISCEDVRNAEY
ncbi:MAG: hypothetical protein JXA30_12550 [Deltaproteobacteria bacterium]|nr:hypothetical protein [Deltaproteobacteria bacterium]